MADINKYLIEGKVQHDKVVYDIYVGKISKNDILELDKNPIFSKSYFNIGNFKREDKALWDSRYLDKLLLVSVGESFCKEYLLYLSEVVSYVAENKYKKQRNKDRLSKGLGILAVIGISLVLYKIFILK